MMPYTSPPYESATLPAAVAGPPMRKAWSGEGSGLGVNTPRPVPSSTYRSDTGDANWTLLGYQGEMGSWYGPGLLRVHVGSSQAMTSWGPRGPAIGALALGRTMATSGVE